MKRGVGKYLLLGVIFLAVTVMFPAAPSFSQTITRLKEYRYQASEIDSKSSSRTLALDQVKRLLLEEIGTYLVTNTEVKNFQLTKDQIVTVSAGIVRTKILSENWDGHTYYLKAEMEVDPKEASRLLDSLRANSEGTRQLDEIIKKVQQQDGEIRTLKEELRKTTAVDVRDKIQQYANAVQGLSATEWMIKGYTAINEERFNDAIDAYNKALEITPQNDVCYYFRGMAFSRIRHDTRAIEDFSQAIAISPAYAFAYKDRAITRLRQGQTELAFQDINKALEIDSKIEVFYAVRGIMYDAAGNKQKAIEDHTHAIQLNPLFAPAYIGRAIVYASVGKNDEALQDHNKTIELDPRSPAPYSQRAWFYSNTVKDYTSAISDFSKAIELAQGLPNALADAYSGRASAYEGLGRDQDAMQDITRSIDLFPHYSFTYCARGKLFAKIGKYQESFSDFNKALELEPLSAEALRGRGVARLAFKDFPGAISDFTKLIKVNPNFGVAYAGRAFAYEGIGSSSQAIEDLKIAAKLEDPLSQKLLKEKGIDWALVTITKPHEQPLNEKRMDSTGKTLAEVTKPTIVQKTIAAQQKTEYSDFSIGLTGCRFVNNSVLCDLLITNKDPERVLGISNDVYVLKEWLFKTHRTVPTRIFDDIGNEYKAASIQFGGRKDKMPQSSLVQNIPARAVLTFDSVFPEPSRLLLLEIGFFDGDSNSFKVTFKDITLSRGTGSGTIVKSEVEPPRGIKGKYTLKRYTLKQSDGVTITENDAKMTGTTEIDSDTWRGSIVFGGKETKLSGKYELVYKMRNSGTYVWRTDNKTIEGEFEITDNGSLNTHTHAINEQTGLPLESWVTWTRIGE